MQISVQTSTDKAKQGSQTCPPLRVPLALKEQFKQELDNMVSQGIISKFICSSQKT